VGGVNYRPQIKGFQIWQLIKGGHKIANYLSSRIRIFLSNIEIILLSKKTFYMVIIFILYPIQKAEIVCDFWYRTIRFIKIWYDIDTLQLSIKVVTHYRKEPYFWDSFYFQYFLRLKS
jgi:hypothetical protein